MFNFKFYTPTKVVFGKDTEKQVADLIEEFGGKKVLIHYGGGSVIRSGLMQRVTDTLDAAGIDYISLGGAVPNPRLGLVYEGIDLCKKEGVDFILAVGGGSAIDSAKAIGYGVTNEGDVWDFYDYKRQATACLPRFKKFATNVTGVENVGTDEEIALKGIEALEAFYHEINMPTNLRELGVEATDEDLVTMAHKCAVGVGGAMGSARLLNEEDMLAIFRACK